MNDEPALEIVKRDINQELSHMKRDVATYTIQLIKK